MKYSSTLTPLLAIGLLSFLGACAAPQSEKDMMLEAQFCMDTANSSEIDGCLSKISHLKTEAASALRCAGGFIKAELTSPENLGEAINALMDDGGGAVTMLGALKMSTDAEAEQTFKECNASGSSSYMLLGAMSRSSTKLATVLSSNASSDCTTLACSVDEVKKGLEELLNPATMDQTEVTAAINTIGETISVVYEVSCTGKKANTDICGMIDEALGPDAAAIVADAGQLGDKLLTYWKCTQDNPNNTSQCVVQ